jgi:ribosomal protein S18 acetylase RimI-like enzyme
MPGILLLGPDAENGGMVQEIAPQELLATTTIPFVRHQVDPAVTRHAWALGDAVVVDGARGRPGDVTLGPVYTCLGPPEDLTPLMAYVDRVVRRPWRVTVEQPAEGPWPRPVTHDWHWMLTQEPVQPDTRWDVSVLGDEDTAAIDELLDEANPGSFARPGSPGLSAWLGVRDGDRIIAAGAVQRTHDGTGHLRGVTVLPDLRRKGVGVALSAALTEHALRQGSGTATLGVYTDNAAAIRLYERLGYRVVHTFRSGVVAP